MVTALLGHQRAALGWMRRREREGDPLASVWELRRDKGREAWYNKLTNSSVTTPPRAVYGGILADEVR
jgi:hypothetical protein